MNLDEDRSGVRLAKFLARAGVAARRKCEELIAQGRVTVNGETVSTPVFFVRPGVDHVCFEGQEITLLEHEYILFNKPRGFTCTADDPHARRVIYDLLPENMRHLKYVGRLDRDTEGLILLTNDGLLLEAMTHPSHEIEKVYRADCAGEFREEMRRQMLAGLEDEGDFLKARAVRFLRSLEDGCLLELVLTEGKKREVRRLCAAVGLEVRRLARVAEAGLYLGDLEPSAWRHLTQAEIVGLKRSCSL